MKIILLFFLNLNIAISNVIIPNIIIGIGLTFCVIPSTTLIYSNVSKEEMTNASSLQNLVKNVGCAVGTSSVGVLVSRYAQIHQSYLVDKMTTLDSVFAERLDTMTASFMQMGGDMLTSQAQAGAMLYRQLLQQSTLCAYMSAYKIYAIAILLVLPLVFCLKKVNYKTHIIKGKQG